MLRYNCCRETALFFLTPTLLCLGARAQSMSVANCLVDDQVVQRDADGKAALPLCGSASGAEGRAIQARVLARQIPAPGFDWRTIATVQDGKWAGAIEGVPAGGPYRVEFRLAGSGSSSRVTGVLVGDLWLLAGQSNMEGRGYLVEAVAPDPRVHSFDMRDHWLVGEEPLHTRVDSVDPVYWFLNEKKVKAPYTPERVERYNRQRDRGTGLGLPFALEMLRRTGVPVGVIPCALGGTSMDEWSPDLKHKGGESLYGATLRRVRAAGSKLKGVVWYQGESDASRKQAPLFQGKFERFVAALRQDLAAPGLPFYYVQAGRCVTAEDIGDQWNMVQEAQRTAEAKIPRSGMVAAVDLELVDSAHADAASLKRLGLRLANLACRDLFPEVTACAGLKPGPRPVKATVKAFPYISVVTVSFSGVNGRLRAAGRMAGFTIHNSAGAVLPIVYAVEPDPSDPSSVLVRVSGKVPAGAVLRYGYGTDPYCNLADEAGMAAPAFGPMPLE